MDETVEPNGLYLPEPESNFTQIPNHYFDYIMPRIKNLAASSCYQFLLRKTWGWNKIGDWISLSQFGEGTGLSKNSVIAGLKWLDNNGFIWVATLGTIGTQQKIYFLKSENNRAIESMYKNGILTDEKLKQMIKFEGDVARYRKAVKMGTFIPEDLGS